MTLKEAKEYTNWLLCKLVTLYAVGAVVLLMVSETQFFRDDSDVPNGDRSGMQIRTDALTKCQYFESRAGHLTPRLGELGKQVGCRKP